MNLEPKASRSHITVSFVALGFCFIFMKKERRSFQTVVAYFSEYVFQNVDQTPREESSIFIQPAQISYVGMVGHSLSNLHRIFISAVPPIVFSPALLSVGLRVSEGHFDHRMGSDQCRLWCWSAYPSTSELTGTRPLRVTGSTGHPCPQSCAVCPHRSTLPSAPASWLPAMAQHNLASW